MSITKRSAALASIMSTYTDSEDENDMDNDLQESSYTPKRVNLQNAQVSEDEGVFVLGSEGLSSLSGSPFSDAAEQLSSECQDFNSDGEEDAYGVVIPPRPHAAYPVELQEKFDVYFEKVQSGQFDINKYIQQKKEFRNPSMYEKLLQFCEIDEFGTNYSPDVFDPFKWTKDSYYEELAKERVAAMEKLENEWKGQSNTEIVVSAAASTAEKYTNERRSCNRDQAVTNSNIVAVKPGTAAAQRSTATSAKDKKAKAFRFLPKRRM